MKPASIVPPAPTQHEIGPGHVLGRYELLMPIAAGGMAMVWAARLKGTRGFQKIVAVKTMLPKLSEDDQFEKMFLDEASLASKIRHPNAVEILDLGEQDGVLFLAMEWIDGVPLNQLMKAAKHKGGVPPTVATRIVMQACAGLHAAHELTDKGQSIGLVHRDISPQNILVTFDGVAKVVDFGVAKATALGDGATQAGQLKGKVSYMAPEQVRGEPIDRRVDVFAMGIVLYALTTGKHPFRKESEGATLFAITAPEPVTAPRKFIPDYPPALQDVLLKALEKDRDQRYASASELLKALDKALPTGARGSDEEVGAFVLSLFQEQRKQSQTALAEALERADKHQLSPRISPKFAESTLSGQSGVSGMSTVGLAASLTPLNASDMDAALAGGKGKNVVRWAIVGGLCVLGALVGILFASANKPAEPAAAAKVAPSAPPAVAPLGSPTPPSAPAVALDALPLEPLPSSAASSSPTANSTSHKPPQRGAPAALAPAKPAPAVTPAPATKPSWKHDPGF